MASHQFLPSEFQASYEARDEYPTNLVHRTISTYPSALKEYRRRLDAATENLLETNIQRVEISFRDFKTNDGEGQDDKLNVHSPQRLSEHLTIQIRRSMTGDSKTELSVTKKDPKCRFIYIYAKDSRERLKLTRSMLVETLTFHQIMPDYLDFMFVFGEQEQAMDLGFSSFREQMTLKLSHRALGIEALGRSGRQYQLCYNLKGVTNKQQSSGGVSFSIRPAAFYHRFDVENGNTLWTVTKGGLDLDDRFIELTGPDARPEDKAFGTPEECFRSSLSAHLLFCHWSTEDWRGYIKWLESGVDSQTRIALLDPYVVGRFHRVYTTGDIQVLLDLQEKIDNAIMQMQSNVEVMSSLRRFYVKLKQNSDFELRDTCLEDIDVFANEVDNLVNNFQLQNSRAKALLKRISGRTELVKQHRLERLNQHMENEAIVVRIITIVTLLYLPATFVSSFFSTDVVKYQAQGPGGSFSQLALNRWLQVTVPLTVATVLLSYLALVWAESKSGPTKKSEEQFGQLHSSASL
ncbi:unnamed protein product [Discula destructiva]